ncbi:MAG: flavodoxin-dependent (E)-4-hydroxy-3-methylbut-2-enyl-diphosphate synthase, partial [Oscillospiraceae bacterium]|nr:flavodoxin-dependent (E)-4-hydroxy-3-methylbut-2-enyl-diphosphate synthase [Oscillospiraceae bacterium]
MNRKPTKKINVGGIAIGGGSPLSVQSMCNTSTADAAASLAQIRALYEAGCDIVRLAVPDMAAAKAMERIAAESPIPVVADIHFDYRLALACAKAGVHKIRINPGNIGGADRVRAVAEACGEKGIPIRIGVNSGSLEKELLRKYGAPTAEAMVESAERHIAMFAHCGFEDICLSLKASDVPLTVAAYRLAAERFPYPLHVGVTEAGTSYMGLVQSAVGIGTLLNEGIGDTIRVSLTADPVEEIKAGIA